MISQPDLAFLQTTYSRPGALAFEASPLGGIVARLTFGQHESLVALQGAQVLSWVCNGAEQLWLSPHARLGIGKPVRGGIPVCWPWFGPHPYDEAKPNHGFVRTRIWEVVGTVAESDGVSIELAAETSLADLAIWPQEAQVRLTVRLNNRLALSLTTLNMGDVPFILTEALHTYFSVSSIDLVRIEGLAKCAYVDKIDNCTRKMQAGAIEIAHEVDRIYLGGTASVSLIDDGASQRRVSIMSRGSRSAVVWNPWIDKTARLGDMGGPDAYRHMVCIETANAGDDVVKVDRGGQHVMAVEYRVT